MRKIKYQTRFIIYHTAILIIIILALVMCFYKLLSKNFKEKDKNDFNVIAEKTADQIDSLFYEMDLVALQIAANPYVVNVFQTIPNNRESNYFNTHIEVYADLRKLLESYNFKNGSFSRLCLYNNFKDFVCTSNLAITDKGIKQFFNNNEIDELNKYFKQEKHHIYFKYPQNDVLSGENSNIRYFSIIREIKDYYSNSQRCGYIEVQENLDKISNILSDLDKDICVIIKDKNGKIFYSSNNIDEKKHTNKVYTRYIELNNAPYEISFTKLPVGYISFINQFIIILVLSVIILIFAAILLEKSLIGYLTKPLLELNKSIEAVTIDNLQVNIIDDNSIDVLANLEKSFNHMLIKLNDSMNRQIVSHTNELKSHYFALQAQVNPHFIHNMLAIISMEAQENKNENIPSICQSLGNILRYNAHMGDGFTTINMECEAVINYMKLMKIRYEDLFDYEINIDKNIQGIKIPKLILQPICENCFKHGLKNVEPKWMISIHAYSKYNKWYIKISDNGSGFKEEFLKTFTEKKYKLNDIKNSLKDLEIGGLSLMNIYMRLIIEYEDSTVFELYNTKNGAEVLIGGNIFD